jgi:pilus assembly protein CpaC
MKLLTAGIIAACSLALAAAAPSAFATPLHGGDGAVPASTAGSISNGGRTISMGVGKSLIIDLPQDASEIFVGNPAVANAVVRSTRKLYIVAVANGQTSIYAMDKAGRQIAAFQISVGRDIGELQQILRTALPRDTITARTVSDTIILTGTVESAGDAQQALDIAKGFAGTIASKAQGSVDPESQVINSLTIKGKDQVMLKVSIVEVQRAVLKELGVNQSGSWSTGAFNLSTPLSLNGSVGTLVQKFTSGSDSLQTTLQAFERYGVSRILAEPTVTAISGENAKFTAGGEIPVPTSQTCTPVVGGLGGSDCTVGIAFKQYGVTLNFAPVVLSEGRILLRIATEVTEIDPDRTFNFTNITVNGFTTRKNETTVELPSGGSIVTAGLLSTTSRHVIAGLPALMNLPILGALFRSRDYQRDETELMIVVTPYIARALAPEQVARPDDGLSDATDPQSWFLGRVNRLYSTTSNPQALQNFRGRVGFIND